MYCCNSHNTNKILQANVLMKCYYLPVFVVFRNWVTSMWIRLHSLATSKQIRTASGEK